MTTEEKKRLEAIIVERLKSIYDPEIPVDIYSLGLIYHVKIEDDASVNITMTLTAPNCPMADELLQEVHDKIESIEQVTKASIDLTFEPTWSQDMMSDEAMLEMGLL